jgi:hypothetical protein
LEYGSFAAKYEPSCGFRPFAVLRSSEGSIF